MIDKLIEDINKALDSEAYLAALSLALTLPDICGKAEFPSAGCGRRYIDWYDEHIGQYEHPPFKEDEPKLPYLSGEVVFQLRCSMLHQGTPNINPQNIKDPICRIDRFELVIEKKNTLDIYTDFSARSKDYWNGQLSNEKRTYKVSVRRLCFILCTCAQSYYDKNKEKFNFFNYTITNYD